MTSISHQQYCIELKTQTSSSSSSSSSSLLSTASTFSSISSISDNESNQQYCVENKARTISSSSILSTSSSISSTSDNEKNSISSEKQQRKRLRKAHNTSYLPLLKLPDFPVKTQCPSCNKYVVTQLDYKNGTFVYLFAMGLFVSTVVLFWVPFFMDSCKDVTHSCPNCKSTLGTRRKI